MSVVLKMWVKFVIVQALTLVAAFYVCKAIVHLINKWCASSNYKIKNQFYSIIVLLITLTIGFFLGGEILYKIL